MGKTIAIACHKGGVGKTTTVISMSGILAASGKRVLMVDTDPQANLTSTYIKDAGVKNLYGAFKDARNSKTYSLPIYNIGKNLDICPSCLDVAALDSEIAPVIGRERILKKLIAPVKDRYDYIFIDCAAQVGIMMSNAFTAADNVLIPINCDGYSAQGFQNLRSLIGEIQEEFNPGLKILGLFVTRFMKNRKADRDILVALEANLNDVLCRTVIRECADFSKATIVGEDILTFNAKSRGAEDYMALVNELFG